MGQIVLYIKKERTPLSFFKLPVYIDNGLLCNDIKMFPDDYVLSYMYNILREHYNNDKPIRLKNKLPMCYFHNQWNECLMKLFYFLSYIPPFNESRLVLGQVLIYIICRFSGKVAHNL